MPFLCGNYVGYLAVFLNQRQFVVAILFYILVFSIFNEMGVCYKVNHMLTMISRSQDTREISTLTLYQAGQLAIS